MALRRLAMAPLLAADTVSAADMLAQNAPTQLPIEQLLTLEISTAPKFSQKGRDAPSMVTVISADDIKTYGYRALSDILKSMRGLYVNCDRNANAFAKLSYRAWSLEAGHVTRKKGIPPASCGRVFNNPRSYTIDRQSFIDLKYSDQLSEQLKLSGKLYFGDYRYGGDYVLNYPPLTVNRDYIHGRRWGSGVKLISRAWQNHKALLGTEYQDNRQQLQQNFDADPFFSYLDDNRRSRRAGVFVQDELTLNEQWLPNAGLRYDQYSSFGGIANPALQPEKIRTYEIAVEHYPQEQTRVSAPFYRQQVSNLIEQMVDPADGLYVFQNNAKHRVNGAELELDHLWRSGARLRTSYSWQLARDGTTGLILGNSPKQLVKANYSMPLPGNWLKLGLEASYTAARLTRTNAVSGGYSLANPTLSSERLGADGRGLAVSASIYNSFDKKYADPAPTAQVQDMLQQGGRSFRVKFDYHF